MSRASLIVAGFGGTYERAKNSQWYVSYWHVPNGTNYDMAVTIKAFFERKADADKAAKELDVDRTCVPIVYPVQEWLRGGKNVETN